MGDEFIVLGVTSYDLSVIRWLHTLREVYDGKVILFMTSREDLVEPLSRLYNVEIRYRTVTNGFWNWKNFNQWQFVLEVALEYPESTILRTDVFDVFFQADPRPFVDEPETIYVAEEGAINSECPINDPWVKYSPYLPEIAALGYWERPVLNAGLVVAKGRQLASLARYQLDNPLQAMTDQPSFNLWFCEQTEKVKYVPGFMECFWKQFLIHKRGELINGTIIDRELKTPWAVVHANGAKLLIERRFCPLEKFARIEQSISPDFTEQNKQTLKNLVVIAICSYSPCVLRWLISLRGVFDGKVILVLTDHEYMVDQLAVKFNVDIRYRPEPAEFWQSKSHRLFMGQWKYILEIAKEYPDSWILRTDPYDVVFQSDPRSAVGSEKITEGVVYASLEPFVNCHGDSANWVKHSSEPKTIDDLGYLFRQTICSGVILAKGSQFVSLSNYIIENRLQVRADQPAFALWIYEHKIPHRYIYGFIETLLWNQPANDKHFIDPIYRRPISVVHGNHVSTEKFDRFYPVSKYIELT